MDIKVVDKEVEFKPLIVEITLQTQEEINAFYSLGNHWNPIKDLLTERKKRSDYQHDGRFIPKDMAEILRTFYDIARPFVRW